MSICACKKLLYVLIFFITYIVIGYISWCLIPEYVQYFWKTRSAILLISLVLLFLRYPRISSVLALLGVELWIVQIVYSQNKPFFVFVFVLAYFYLIIKYNRSIGVSFRNFISFILDNGFFVISLILTEIDLFIEGKNPDILILKGNISYSKGSYRKAIEYYNTAENDSNKAEVAYNIGTCYFSAGEYESALSFYLKSVDDEKIIFKSLMNIIAVTFILGRIRECEKYISQTSKLSVIDSTFCYLEGLLIEYSGKKEKALLEYSKVTSESEYYDKAQIRIAVIMYQDNKREKLEALTEKYKLKSKEFKELFEYFRHDSLSLPWLLKDIALLTLEERLKWVSN